MRAGALLAMVAALGCWQPAGGETYSLSFNKSSDRLNWQPSLPSWNWAFPVAFSARQDSMRVSVSASLAYALDQREGLNAWQDNASIRSSVNYPILGPRASIGIQASASSRSATLQQQKIRSQSYGFRFQYNPFQEGSFRSLSATVIPAAITARRASRAKLDSTIEEKGVEYNASLRVSPELELAGNKLNSSLSASKRDNTLKNNKDRNENLNLSLGYTLPYEVRTNTNFSETRSQQGVTRAKISEIQLEERVRRDTAVVAELSQTLSTNFSSDLAFKAGNFDVSSRAGFSESTTTNTANDDEDPRNQFFAKDHENRTWSLSTNLSGKLHDQLTGNASFKYGLSEARRLAVQLADGRLFRDPTDDLEKLNLSLSGSLNWQFAEDHSLTLSSQAQSLRDDNPGAPEQNRDTFISSSKLSYKGEFASGLNLDIGLSTNFSHRVNLDARSSGDNSRNKDLILDAATRYERLGTSITHNFGISAKRTVFDFDRRVNRRPEDRRSNIRRGWNMRHAVQRRFFENLRLNSSYAYSADDFGLLIVEDQAQLVKEDNADHALSGGISYSLGKALSLGVNYSFRLDRQWTYDYRQGREQQLLNRCSRHRNLGVTLSYNPSQLSNMSFGVSRSHQENCDPRAAAVQARNFDSFNVKLSKTL